MPQKPAMTPRELVEEWRSLAASYHATYKTTWRAHYSRISAAYAYCADGLKRALDAEEGVDLVEEEDDLDRYFREFVEP